MKLLAPLVWFCCLPSPAGTPGVDFALGVLAGQRGDAVAAAAAFGKALSADPDAFPLMQRVAGLRLAANDVEGASTLYRDYAARHPQRLDAQLAHADFLRDVSSGDASVAMAREILEKALGNFPGELSVLERLFRVYESQGERDHSLRVFEMLAGSSPEPAGALVAAGMARTLFARDDMEARARVDALFVDACRRFPEDPVLARAASEHFRITGRLPEAAETLGRHVEAVPSSIELRTRHGIVLLAAGNEREGEAALLDVVTIDPNQGLARQSLAKLYRRQERTGEARLHAAEALKIRGGGAAEFLELADEFLAADQPRDARLLLEKAVFFHPEDAGAAAKLAVASRRDPESRGRASRLFREAEGISGDGGPASDPVFLSEFAECLMESGQTNAAEERLRAAIREFPPEEKKETARALRRLAGIWQSEKRNGEAAEALLQRAESLDPR